MHIYNTYIDEAFCLAIAILSEEKVDVFSEIYNITNVHVMNLLSAKQPH